MDCPTTSRGGRRHPSGLYDTEWDNGTLSQFGGAWGFAYLVLAVAAFGFYNGAVGRSGLVRQIAVGIGFAANLSLLIVLAYLTVRAYVWESRLHSLLQPLIGPRLSLSQRSGRPLDVHIYVTTTGLRLGWIVAVLLLFVGVLLAVPSTVERFAYVGLYLAAVGFSVAVPTLVWIADADSVRRGLEWVFTRSVAGAAFCAVLIAAGMLLVVGSVTRVRRWWLLATLGALVLPVVPLSSAPIPDEPPNVVVDYTYPPSAYVVFLVPPLGLLGAIRTYRWWRGQPH